MNDPKRKSKAEIERDVNAILSGKNTKPDKIVEWLPIDELIPYPDHPFKLYEGERLDDMVRSIKELGVLQPIIVRPLPDGGTYEILSGHNRVNAAKIAELKEVPCIIKENLSDEDAKLIVTETNLVQRSFKDLSHSERAVALKLHMDTISRQGKRNDLINEIETLLNPDETNENKTCDPAEHKLKSRERTAKKYDLSPSNVTRYLRAARLIRPLLERMDKGEIALRPAVALSYLTIDEQTALEAALCATPCKIDMIKADAFRLISENKKFTDDKIAKILSGEINSVLKPKSPPVLKIKHTVYSKFFKENTNQKEIALIIEQALTEYFANQKNDERTE